MSVTSDDGYIHVNYGQVNDVLDALQGADQSIGMVLDELQHTIGPLVSSWLGPSQQEYSNVQARWNNDMNDMSAQLVKSAAVLEGMSTNYANTDNNLSMQWSEIT
jgi:WXG100 family type VII secretion target